MNTVLPFPLSHGAEAWSDLGQQDFNQLTVTSPRADVIAFGTYLSIANSLEDGSPIPPTKHHIRAAALAGNGCSRYVVEKVVGGIAALQEEIGFVMPGTREGWSERQWIENGIWLSHMLGTPEHPVMPEQPTLDQASGLYISPAYDRIAQKFGSIANYQDKLGFVTSATYERWTDQDWIDNGIWLSHMLGTPDKPVMPTKVSIEAGSAVRVSPSVVAIREHFGTIADYQRALGFAVRKRELGYETWDRQKYIENGIWLSHMLGTPDKPVMPTKDDIQRFSEVDLCPPPSSALSGFKGQMTRYQDAIGFVTDYTLERWSEQDWIDNGIWLSHAAGTPEEPAYVGYKVLREASVLNIGPSEHQVWDHYNAPLAHYQSLIGQEPDKNVAARRISNRAVLQEGLRLLGATGVKRLQTEDFNNSESLTFKMAQGRFGTIDDFNVRLGLPDPREWSEAEFVTHGVQYALANDGNMLPLEDFKALRSVKVKPGAYKPSSYKQFTAAVRAAVPEYVQRRTALTQEVGFGEQVFNYVARDFEPTEEFEEQCRDRLKLLYGLDQQGVRVEYLSEMFRKSRVTLAWERADYIFFGRKLGTSGDGFTIDRGVETLRTLDRYGLSPFLGDIVDMFGSLEAFIAESAPTKVQK